MFAGVDRGCLFQLGVHLTEVRTLINTASLVMVRQFAGARITFAQGGANAPPTHFEPFDSLCLATSQSR